MSKIARPTTSVTARTRRTVAALVATAVVVTAFAAARGGRDVRPPRAARPAAAPATRPQVTRKATSVSPEAAARTFVSSYVSFLYGRRAATDVVPVGQRLHRQLLDARSTATPAELTRPLVVRNLIVNADTRGTAIGSAVVDDGAAPPYALSFDLTLRKGRWVVTAVERGAWR